MMHEDIYPHQPGHRGVHTSVEAAEAIQPVTALVQRLVLEAVRQAGAYGRTANELAGILQMERTTVQPRTSELKVMGRIEDSGQRRHNPNGKRAIVWVLAKDADHD